MFTKRSRRVDAQDASSESAELRDRANLARLSGDSEYAISCRFHEAQS